MISDIFFSRRVKPNREIIDNNMMTVRPTTFSLARMDYHSPVVGRLAAEMKRRPGGSLPFSDFVKECHYGKGGFYNSVVRIGQNGSFQTAPHSQGPLLGSALAVYTARLWSLLGSPKQFSLVEGGAGHGKMMVDLLDHLHANYPKTYSAVQVTILEISEGLIPSQQLTLGEHFRKITWLNQDVRQAGKIGELGLLITNELLDDLPFDLWRVTCQPQNNVWLSRWQNLHVAYKMDNSLGRERFSFAPANEIVWMISDEQPDHPILMEPGTGSEEELEYQAFLLARQHLNYSHEPQIVALSPGPLAEYVGRSLNAFSFGVSLSIDYGFCNHGLPAAFVYDRGERTDILRALERPGLVNPTHSVNFSWTGEQAQNRGAKTFTTDRNGFLSAQRQPRISITSGGVDHLVQLQSRMIPPAIFLH